MRIKANGESCDANTVPSLNYEEGVTTIPKGSRFKAKFLIPKCSLS